jgi:hypothetical protein
MGMLRPVVTNESENPFIADKVNAILMQSPDSPLKNEYILGLKKAAEERLLDDEEFFFQILDEKARRRFEDDAYHARLLKQAEDAMRRAFAIHAYISKMPIFTEESKKFKARLGHKILDLSALVEALHELESVLQELEDLQYQLVANMARVQRDYVDAVRKDFADSAVTLKIGDIDCELNITQHENYEEFLDRAAKRALTTEQKAGDLAKRDANHPVLVCRRELADQLRQAYSNEKDEIVKEQTVSQKVNETVRFLSNDYLNDISIQNMLYDQFKRTYAAELAAGLKTDRIFKLLRISLNSREYGKQQADYANNLAAQDAVFVKASVTADKLRQMRNDYSPQLLNLLFDVKQGNESLATQIDQVETAVKNVNASLMALTPLPKPMPSNQKARENNDEDANNFKAVQNRKNKQAKEDFEENNSKIITKHDPLFGKANDDAIDIMRETAKKFGMSLEYSSKFNPAASPAPAA